jgi:UDP-N-acetylglucosamine 2-epimerase (non-hydrolysing)
MNERESAKAVPRLKVMTIVGTRPEVIKLSRVLAELERHTDHVLVHTGQNFDYELNEIFFEELELRRPDHFLEAAAETPSETIAQVISRIDPLLTSHRPDAVLIYGDTNSCLAVIAAKRRKIPIFHMEAGNRCFDQRVPEELNRKIVDHLSDVNMPQTEHARRYLLAEGLRPDLVIKTGSPMREVLRHYRPAISRSPVLQTLGLAPQEYLLVSAHREENVDSEDELRALIEGVAAASRTFARRVVFSTHPRTRSRLQAAGLVDAHASIAFLKPLGFIDYACLQEHAFCVLSDSGTLTEEAAMLGMPAVTLRKEHERPEGMDCGVVLMSGLDTERILQCVALATSVSEVPADPVPDYQAVAVSRQVVRIIVSYVDYVRRVIWHNHTA